MRRLLSVLLLALSAFGGNVAATQYLARTFGYARELGAPLLVFSATRLYAPFSWFVWRGLWTSYAPRPFAIATGLVLGGVLLGLFFASLVAGKRSIMPKPTGAYGTARWATTAELAEAELLGSQGVVLCQTGEAQIDRRKAGWRQVHAGDLVRHDGQEHVFVFAPTGSGKGVGVVLPTLLSWTSSVVVYDLKRENWELTSGWRSKFSHCLRFEPSAQHSVRFNPLMEVRPWPYDVRDAQNIVEILVNPDSMSERQRDYWQNAGQAFLVGVLLHVLYAEQDKSLAGVLRAITDPDRDIDGLLDAMLTTNHLPTGPHPVVAGGARGMLNKSPNDRSGVISTAESFLGLYRDPILAANTSASDFSLSDLMCSERPVSLYLVVPPPDTDRTKPIMRLLLNFIAGRLTEHLSEVGGTAGLRPKRHRLLYLIDEFPTLGRMPFFEVQLAYLRGYQVKCMLIAQSLSQLDKAYGENNSLLDNCHVRLTYATNCARTAKRIGDLLGQASLMKVQISEGEKKGLFGKPHVTKSYQEYGRALKTPDELLALPYPDAILLVGNLRPYAAKKVIVYDDPRFLGRLWDHRSKLNHPPASPAAQRAALPPVAGLPHWLSLNPIPSTAKPKPPPASTPASTAAPIDDEALFEPVPDSAPEVSPSSIGELWKSLIQDPDAIESP